jgi:hypothetical protein
MGWATAKPGPVHTGEGGELSAICAAMVAWDIETNAGLGVRSTQRIRPRCDGRRARPGRGAASRRRS